MNDVPVLVSTPPVAECGLADLAVDTQGVSRQRPDAETVIVPIIGEIGVGPNTTDKIISQIGDAKNILLAINSQGGCSLSTHRILKALEGRNVRAEIRGCCWSAGVLLTLIADHVRMEVSSTILVHCSTAWVNGNYKQFEEASRALRQVEDAHARMLKTKIKFPEFVDQWIADGENHILKATESLAMGLCDELFVSPAPCVTALRTDESRVLDMVKSLAPFRVHSRDKFAHNMGAVAFYHSIEIEKELPQAAPAL